MIFLAVIVLAAVMLFYLILHMDIPGSWKFALIVVEMLLVSQVFIRRYKMPSELGLVLLKSKEGIAWIDRLAKGESRFNFMADVGATASYGLLSFVLMRRNVTLPSMIIGLLLLAFLSFFVAPVSLAFLLSAAGLGGVSSSAASAASSLDLGWIFGVVLALGGLFLFIMVGIVYYGAVVFNALVTTVFYGTNAIAKTAPGGDLLLPGVNLPLFEGILALAIVMIVHEGAHAVLTRIARVPLLSSGLVLFGVIPIGAFVEPDEKKLQHVQQDKQTRVLVAGPTANLFTAVFSFIILMSFFYLTTDMRQGSIYVQSGMQSGTFIYEINNRSVDSINFTAFSLPKNTPVELATNRGLISRTTDANGKIGITFVPLSKETLFSRYVSPPLEFIYTTLGLIVALNFVVGTVNILPVPLFDGYRILDINVKNKMIVKAISYVALFFFVLNFLPRFFH